MSPDKKVLTAVYTVEAFVEKDEQKILSFVRYLLLRWKTEKYHL